jgi:hypothetical protein
MPARALSRLSSRHLPSALHGPLELELARIAPVTISRPQERRRLPTASCARHIPPAYLVDEASGDAWVRQLDATVVNVALPTVGIELDASVAGLQWILNGYTLTLASLILIGGSLGDRFGRRRIFPVIMLSRPPAVCSPPCSPVPASSPGTA